MDDIVLIRPANSQRLTITLQLTTACTYSCRYCPDTLSKGSAGKFDLSELEQFFKKFPNREIVLTVTGGEPTTHPDLSAVLVCAKELGIKTQVDTNGVRTVRFYQETGALANVWNVTLHPSQHTLDIEKIKVLTDNSFVVVYIMMDPNHWATAIDWWDQLITVENIKVIPLKTISNWAGADFIGNYTTEQTDWLLTTNSKLNLTTEKRQQLIKSDSWLLNAHSIYITDSGYQGELNGYNFVKKGLNKFFGWSCSAGNENILINQDGSANWANCGIKQYKHFLDIDPIELAYPVRCNRVECNCITDIRSTKHV